MIFAVNEEERERARVDNFSWTGDRWTLACSFGVWDEGFNFDRRNRYRLLADTDRHGFCFYWKYRRGMLIPAAKILQEREARYHEARKDRRLTLMGLWIAALALVADVWLTWAAAQKAWPF